MLHIKTDQFSLLDIELQNIPRTDIRSFLEINLKNNKNVHVATVNPEFLVRAHQDSMFKHVLQKADLKTIDGTGIVFWERILYGKKVERITGVELADLLCKIAEKEGYSVFFLGGIDVAEQASEAMKKKYPRLQVAGAMDGDPEKLDSALITAKPDILLVAYGCPKQEIWIAKNKEAIHNLRMAVGVGGTFDFWAGKVPRAPQWMRRFGLEWLYRLVREPRRFKRIWNAVGVFSFYVVRQKFTGKV